MQQQASSSSTAATVIRQDVTSGVPRKQTEQMTAGRTFRRISELRQASEEFLGADGVTAEEDAVFLKEALLELNESDFSAEEHWLWDQGTQHGYSSREADAAIAAHTSWAFGRGASASSWEDSTICGPSKARQRLDKVEAIAKHIDEYHQEMLGRLPRPADGLQRACQVTSSWKRRHVAAGCIWEHGRWHKRADGHGRGAWYNTHESQGAHHQYPHHGGRRSTVLSNRFAPLASTDQEDGDLNDYTLEYRQAAQGRDKDVTNSTPAGRPPNRRKPIRLPVTSQHVADERFQQGIGGIAPPAPQVTLEVCVFDGTGAKRSYTEALQFAKQQGLQVNSTLLDQLIVFYMGNAKSRKGGSKKKMKGDVQPPQTSSSSTATQGMLLTVVNVPRKCGICDCINSVCSGTESCCTEFAENEGLRQSATGGLSPLQPTAQDEGRHTETDVAYSESDGVSFNAADATLHVDQWPDDSGARSSALALFSSAAAPSSLQTPPSDGAVSGTGFISGASHNLISPSDRAISAALASFSEAAAPSLIHQPPREDVAPKAGLARAPEPELHAAETKVVRERSLDFIGRDLVISDAVKLVGTAILQHHAALDLKAADGNINQLSGGCSAPSSALASFSAAAAPSHVLTPPCDGATLGTGVVSGASHDLIAPSDRATLAAQASFSAHAAPSPTREPSSKDEASILASSILEVLAKDQSMVGLSAAQVQQRLRTVYTEQEVRQSLEGLVALSEVFNTTSDEYSLCYDALRTYCLGYFVWHKI